jgi:hypothetical protein
MLGSSTWTIERVSPPGVTAQKGDGRVDSKQFDELVARLASGQSRREALKGIAGGALATVGVTTVASAKGKKGRVGAQGKKKGRVNAEHCLGVGERCDPPKRVREGAKGKRKTHTCDGVENKKGRIVRGCCTRYSVPDGNIRRCACVPDGQPCTQATARNCCSQFCGAENVCETYGAPPP